MKILHLLFHPNINNSRVNKAWFQQISESGKVSKSRNLSAEYSDYQFNIEKEQADLVEHERIVLQYPFYWYNVPALLKKWLEDVLTFGFAYGSGDTKLKGKELQLIISIGGPQESYGPGGYNSFTIGELLKPMQQTATLCGMKFLPPMYMHSAVAADETTIEEYGKKWVSLIDDPDLADPWSVQKRIISEAKKLT